MITVTMFSVCVGERDEPGLICKWGDNFGTQDDAKYETLK
jgi:hypothetical protein